MNFSAKNFLVVIFIFSVLSTLILFFIAQHEERRPRLINDTARSFPNPFFKAQRPVEDSTYTTSGYIVPLKNNATGSAYSPRAQVRGNVKAWRGQTLTIAVTSEETKDIAFAAATRLYCTPAYFTDDKGNRVPASTVWVNVPDSERAGTLIQIADLTRKFPKGSDVLVYVNVGDGDAMTGDLVVGYGCTEL